MKRIFTIAMISVLICFACKTTPPPATYVPNFNFSPPTTSKSALSSTVKIILLHPVYAKGFAFSREPVLVKFSDDMSRNFEEMINARGYVFKGPFGTYDELIFKDKNEMDLCLLPEIDIQFAWDQGAMKSAPNFLTHGTDYWIDGNYTITGRINLQALETLSQQKVWSPSIPLRAQNVYVKTFHHYSSSNIPSNDPNYYNGIAKGLEAVYADAMKTAWNKLDPDELKIVKEDCDKIKTKKTF